MCVVSCESELRYGGHRLSGIRTEPRWIDGNPAPTEHSCFFLMSKLFEESGDNGAVRTDSGGWAHRQSAPPVYLYSKLSHFMRSALLIAASRS